jgi:hypothetical protein
VAVPFVKPKSTVSQIGSVDCVVGKGGESRQYLMHGYPTSVTEWMKRGMQKEQQNIVA